MQIQATFSKDLNTCSVSIDGHIYRDLRVKKINLRDWEEPEWVYLVKVPCAKALGQDYMLSCGRDYIYKYEHPERTELVLNKWTAEDEAKLKPKKKKNQLSLFGEE